MGRKILNWLKIHKIITIIIIIALIGGGYLIYKRSHPNSSNIQYRYAKVQEGDLIVTVSASGQIAALNTVNLKSKTSGTVVYTNLKNGQQVKKGEVLLKIDDTDARNALTTAQINLNRARLTLLKMESGVIANEGSIEANKAKAENDLKLAYEKAVDSLPDLVKNLPDVINNLHDIIYGNDLSTITYNVDYYGQSLVVFNNKAQQFSDEAKNAYDTAKISFDQANQIYKSQNLTYGSNPSDIENCVNAEYQAIKDINNASRAMLNLVQLYKNEMTAANLNYSSKIDSQLSTLNNLFATTSDLFTQISNLKDDIQNKKEAVVNTNFDIEDQKNNVLQIEQQLETAQENLANCTLRAPMDGVLGNVASINVGDEVSTATIVAVLTSRQYVVEISLPEVDAAKVKIGQKATITFDALEDFTATG
ncbi:MAG: HlyD family secretion protein, partial [Minisyncoccia bacterium]